MPGTWANHDILGFGICYPKRRAADQFSLTPSEVSGSEAKATPLSIYFDEQLIRLEMSELFMKAATIHGEDGRPSHSVSAQGFQCGLL